MKGLVFIIAISAGIVALTGQAFCQTYDPSSYGYGGQAQQYGAYGQSQQAYGQGQQYGQSQQASGQGQQYGQSQQAYGQARQYGAYGGQPQYGYGEQQQQQYGAYGQQHGAYGYDQGQAGYYGYQDNGSGQYPGYQNYGGAQAARRGASNASNYSYGPAQPRQSRAMPQTVAYPSGTVGETSSQAVPVPQGKLEREEIYWDGRYTVDDDNDSGVQGAPVQPVQQAQPVVRTPRPTTRAAVTRNGRAVAKPNVVTRESRQTTRTSTPPPAREELKWGKADKPVSQRNFAWGKQEKPAMVGSEPTSLQGARTEMQSSPEVRMEATAPVPSAESAASNKKFQWGKRQ